jgi:hypothetical protein
MILNQNLNWTFWNKFIIIFIILLVIIIISIAWEVIQPSPSKTSLGFSSLISSFSQESSEPFSLQVSRDQCSDDPTIQSSRGVPSCHDLRNQIYSSEQFKKRVPKTGSLKDGNDILDNEVTIILNKNAPEHYQQECSYYSSCDGIINHSTRRLYCPPGIQPIRHATTNEVEGCIGGNSGDLMIYSFNGNGERGLHCKLSSDTSTQRPCRNLREWSYIPNHLHIIYLHEYIHIFKNYFKNETEFKEFIKQLIIFQIIIPYIINNNISLQISENRRLKQLIENHNNEENLTNAERDHFPGLSSFVDTFYQRFVLNVEQNSMSSSRYLIMYLFPKEHSSREREFHYAFSYDNNLLGNVNVSYKAQNGLTITQTIPFPKDTSLDYRINRNDPQSEIDPGRFPTIVFHKFS